MQLAAMQKNRNGNLLIFGNSADLIPNRMSQHAAADEFRCPRISQFLMDCMGHQNFIEQISKDSLLADRNQIAEWGGIGDGNHAAAR